MKKFILFLFAISFLACDNIGQYKDAITTLAGDWDKTTASVTGFADMLKGEQVNFLQMFATMKNIPAETKEKLGEAGTASLNELQISMLKHDNTFNSLISEVNEFIGQWTEKGAEVTALKEGLENGKIEGDVMSKISSLTEMITNGQNKLEGWTGSLNTVKEAAAANFGSFQELIASLTAGPEAN
jgi:hypothetical protein